MGCGRLPSFLCLEQSRRIIGQLVTRERHSTVRDRLGFPRRRQGLAALLELATYFAIDRHIKLGSTRVSHLGYLVIVIAIASTGCSAQAWQAFAQGLATTPTPPPPTKLMVFGGPGHQTYLGCLSCSEFATDSIFNEFSTYGNSFSSQSIFNSYSQFGSPYSAFSACNPYASDPPVVVDEAGNFYGRLTINRY